MGARRNFREGGQAQNRPPQHREKSSKKASHREKVAKKAGYKKKKIVKRLPIFRFFIW